MPNLITHYFFAEDVLNALPEETKALIERNREAYNLGSVGPDFLFTLREIGDVSARYCNRMHYTHVWDTFQRTATYLYRTKNETQIAYMLGLLTHYVIDHRLHPLVNYLAEEGLTQDYTADYQLYIHSLVESTLDEWTLIRKGKNPRTFSSLKCADAPIKVKKEIGLLYREVINKVFRYDVPVSKIIFSMTICNLFGIMWMDKSGLKKKFFNALENAFDLKKSLTSLMRPAVGYGKVDLLNEQKRDWRIVRNEEPTCNLSIIEMCDVLVDEACRYIADYVEVLNTRGTLNKDDFRVNYEGVRTH